MGVVISSTDEGVGSSCEITSCAKLSGTGTEQQRDEKSYCPEPERGER